MIAVYVIFKTCVVKEDITSYDGMMKRVLRKINPKTPANTSLYKYKGQFVISVINPQCTDCLNSVYDLQGKYLGAPSGGISGNGDGKIPDFKTNAVLIHQMKIK